MAADMNPVEMPHYGQWRSSMIGGGGYVQNVVCCPSDPARLLIPTLMSAASIALTMAASIGT